MSVISIFPSNCQQENKEAFFPKCPAIALSFNEHHVQIKYVVMEISGKELCKIGAEEKRSHLKLNTCTLAGLSSGWHT